MPQKKHLIHIKSNQLQTGSQDPKSPTVSDIEYGEIAINYLKDKERMFIKNSNNEIVSFVSSKVIEDNEAVVAAALTDLDDRVIALENLENIIEVTYSELVSLINDSGLKKGVYYRITDYVTATTKINTSSANHQFDIIVMALDSNTLSEKAYAIQHDGDTYFSNSNLSAWDIKYSIYNDTQKYEWADPTNGKGVIYYMSDEFGNKAPYDFKNIMFKRLAFSSVNVSVPGRSRLIYNTTSIPFHYSGFFENIVLGFNNEVTFTVDDTIYGFYYTFSFYDATNSTIMDGSIVCNYNTDTLSSNYQGIVNNEIKPTSLGSCEITESGACLKLCDNVFIVTDKSNISGHGAWNNTIGSGSYGNTFGSGAINIELKQGCTYNTFADECSLITLNNQCVFNIFERSTNNIKFDNGCEYNYIRYTSNNITFDSLCGYNTVNNASSGIKFGAICEHNFIPSSGKNITYGKQCSYNEITANEQLVTFGEACQNNIYEVLNYVTFGHSCTYNGAGASDEKFPSLSSSIFGNKCSLIQISPYNIISNGVTLENDISKIKIGLPCVNLTIESGNTCIELKPDDNIAIQPTLYRNVTIKKGVNYTVTDQWKTIITNDTYNYDNQYAYNVFQPTNTNTIIVPPMQ